MKTIKKPGLIVVDMCTFHAHNRVRKVTSGLLCYAGADYGKCKISPKVEILIGGRLVRKYVPKRAPAYTYDDIHAIYAHYNKSSEPCLPLLIIKNKKWKCHSTKYYDTLTNEEISPKRAEELGYKPNESLWIVPKLSSITDIR